MGRCKLLLLFLLVLGVFTGVEVPSALAQVSSSAEGTLPAGWRSLSASEFNGLAQAGWEGFSKPTRALLKGHAWEAFLNNPEFIASGDEAAVKGLADRFGKLPRGRSEDAIALQQRLAKRLVESGDLPQVIAAMRKIRRRSHGMLGKLDNGAAWKKIYDAGNWQGLPVVDKVEMLLGFSTDLVDRKNLSVRWTGFVKAPKKGSYEFLLVRNGIQDPKFKLSIGGEVLFDSSVDTVAYNDHFISSKPKFLPDRRRVSVVLEMSHVVGEDVSRWPWPTAALLWRTEGGTEQLIPASALTPPAGYQGAKKSGLLGEYFADSEWGQVAGRRVDRQLDFAWWASPIFPKYTEAYDAVLKSCSKDLFELAGSNDHEFEPGSLGLLIGRVGARLSLSKRAELVGAFAANNSAASQARSTDISRLVGVACCLPGGEQLELLDKWSQARGLPRFRPSVAKAGHAQSLSFGEAQDSWSQYWAIGKSLVGPHWDCSQAILDDKLELADGQCNLTLLYIATFAAFEDQRRSRQPRVASVKQKLDEKLKDESLSGDARVSWLIGRAFVEEAGAAHPPVWGIGNDYLKEAALVASTKDVKFWGVQELAARYAARGQRQQLEQLATRLKSKFNKPEQKQLLQACCDMVKHSKEAFASQQQQQKKELNAGYVANLEKRISQARSNGQDEAAARYEKLLLQAKSAGQEGSGF